MEDKKPTKTEIIMRVAIILMVFFYPFSGFAQESKLIPNLNLDPILINDTNNNCYTNLFCAFYPDKFCKKLSKRKIKSQVYYVNSSSEKIYYETKLNGITYDKYVFRLNDSIAFFSFYTHSSEDCTPISKLPEYAISFDICPSVTRYIDLYYPDKDSRSFKIHSVFDVSSNGKIKNGLIFDYDGYYLITDKENDSLNVEKIDFEKDEFDLLSLCEFKFNTLEDFKKVKIGSISNFVYEIHSGYQQIFSIQE